MFWLPIFFARPAGSKLVPPATRRACAPLMALRCLSTVPGVVTLPPPAMYFKAYKRESSDGSAEKIASVALLAKNFAPVVVVMFASQERSVNESQSAAFGLVHGAFTLICFAIRSKLLIIVVTSFDALGSSGGTPIVESYVLCLPLRSRTVFPLLYSGNVSTSNSAIKASTRSIVGPTFAAPSSTIPPLVKLRALTWPPTSFCASRTVTILPAA